MKSVRNFFFLKREDFKKALLLTKTARYVKICEPFPLIEQPVAASLSSVPSVLLRACCPLIWRTQEMKAERTYTKQQRLKVAIFFILHQFPLRVECC